MTEKELLLQATTQEGKIVYSNNMYVHAFSLFEHCNYTDPAPVKSEQQQRKVMEEVLTSPGISGI